MGRTVRNRIFLRLGRDWALGYDALQWIVYRRRKRREERYWNPVGYVTRRDTLWRLLREKRCTIDTQAIQAIHRLPPTFNDWTAPHNAGDQPGDADAGE